ncbi:hypothetical protein [Pyrococcus kukulkanii]|uniref:Uncharacterized protein n=1 Tax=Pyrococcus kukulkanii TaxID=1609559 RepID=A0ABV4T3Z5_9EURY
MLLPYMRNGELFLERIGVKEVSEDVVKEKYLEPIKALTLDLIPVEDDAQALKLLKSYGFEVSVTSKSIIDAFLKRRKGVCSICGKEGEVVENRAFIYPFERKIDSIVNERNRLAFCLEHAFKLYSAMAYLYVVPIGGKDKLKFFFEGEGRAFRRFSYLFREFWRDRSELKNGKVAVKLSLKPYHGNEAFFSVLYDFVDFLRGRRMLQEAYDIERSIRAYLVYGSGQFYGSTIVEGTRLVELTKLLATLAEKKVVKGFFDDLVIPRGKDRKKNTLEREKFFSKLLDGKFDFILLNKIFIERVKRKLRVPRYYLPWARAYFEAFGGDILNPEVFERINGLGYSLGKKVKGTNLEKYFWELFRARGFEEFMNKLVELQAKLEISMDVRPFYENEKNWKVLKAILLNGMLNAIHGGEDEGD